MIRLETTQKRIVQLLKIADESRCRAAAAIACRFALREAPVPDPAVQQGLARISAGEPSTAQEGSELASIVARLDDEYFALQQRQEDDPRLEKAMLAAFSRARAASAVQFAGAGDAFVAAAEGIYEASCALEDSAGMFDAVIRELDR